MYHAEPMEFSILIAKSDIPLLVEGQTTISSLYKEMSQTQTT